MLLKFQKNNKIAVQNIIDSLYNKSYSTYFGCFRNSNNVGSSFADVGVTILAVLNSLRAIKVEK